MPTRNNIPNVFGNITTNFMSKRGYFWSKRLPYGNYKSGFLRYNFGNVVTIKQGGRDWKAKIMEANIDRDMVFQCWQVNIINWKLWYKMFPSDKCTHWLRVADPLLPVGIRHCC